MRQSADVLMRTQRVFTHTLVVGSTSKDISNDWVGVLDQADDGDTGQEGENPARDVKDNQNVDSKRCRKMRGTHHWGKIS